jgi:8-oxo-dGTP diphosphatase
MGVTPVLWPNDSPGLVSARPILACSPIRLFALATSNGLWKGPSTDWNPPARCLAVRQLASRLPQSDVVRKGSQVLAIRRPDDDELPGIWGLPAGTFRDSETLEDLIRRIGRDKLAVSLTPLRKLAEGAQDRQRYRLEMELWEATMTGTPDDGSEEIQWKWTALEGLRQGSERGSLCCRLALSHAG